MDMKWFKKKKEDNEELLREKGMQFRYIQPPTPKHIVPIKELTRFAENAFNSGDKEVEKDLLMSVVNCINRYLNKQTEA